MRRLLWIGSPFFQDALASCGWETTFFNFEDRQILRWDDLLRLAGKTPDVIVVADKSRAPFVVGMERFPCLTVFYSVDSHIHSWQPRYAQGFDACLVSLRDHLPRFYGPGLTADRVWWSPAFAAAKARPVWDAVPEWDCLFVGSVTENTPLRAAFLKGVGERLPLEIRRGDYAELFPRGRVLLNQCEHGDLNFRVFEAAACGGCLVTPRTGHGLTDMFEDGRDIQTYAPGDVEDACRRIRELLDDPDRRERMRRRAHLRVEDGHRATHRAAAFTRKMERLLANAGAVIDARLARAGEIHGRSLRVMYLLWASEMEDPLYRGAYLRAAHSEEPPR